ncbi:hypothetical protein FRC00_005390, partial [Tulasnella sp. 408]
MYLRLPNLLSVKTARVKQLFRPKPPSTGARDLFDLKYGDDGQVIQVTDDFRDIVGSIALSQADHATRPALHAIQELVSWDPARGEKKWRPLAETIQAILDRDWSSTTWDSDISLLRGLWYRLQETVMEMLDVFRERLNLPISLKYNKESLGEHRWMVDDVERLRDLVTYLDREITRVEDTI